MNKYAEIEITLTLGTSKEVWSHYEKVYENKSIERCTDAENNKEALLFVINRFTKGNPVAVLEDPTNGATSLLFPERYMRGDVQISFVKEHSFEKVL